MTAENPDEGLLVSKQTRELLAAVIRTNDAPEHERASWGLVRAAYTDGRIAALDAIDRGEIRDDVDAITVELEALIDRLKRNAAREREGAKNAHARGRANAFDTAALWVRRVVEDLGLEAEDE